MEFAPSHGAGESKARVQTVSLCSQGPIPLDALDLPRGCRLFQSKSSPGMQPPTGRKSRRTMTSLHPGLGRWEPGSPAFAPNTQLFPKGKEGSHRPCPLREGAEQFVETLPSSKEGRITRGGGPARTEDSPGQGSRCLPQWDSGTCSQTRLGSSAGHV